MTPEFTREEVSLHDHSGSCWITYDKKVYDVTQFLVDHPAGAGILLEQAGRDVTAAMNDPREHLHSKVAFSILEKYLVGALIGDSLPPRNEVLKDGEKASKGDAHFLDLERPLFWQLLVERKYTKAYYLQQVHIGRHMDRSARLFAWGSLEVFTKTPWWIIPIVWSPVVLFFALEALKRYSVERFILFYSFGIFLWTLLEYAFHRFFFHLDVLLPNHRIAFAVHFLIHGIHHFLPMDSYRLVMPPLLFAVLTLFVYSVMSRILPYNLKCGLLSGAITGYIAYDLLHYSFHHARMSSRLLKYLKTYHLRHHYEDGSRGFGVSSPLWDNVFGTSL